MTPDDHTPPAAAPTLPLPPEVREAIARHIYNTPYGGLFVPMRTNVDAFCAALAPLWPRPAPVDPKELHAYIKRHLPGYTLIQTGEVKAQAQDSSPAPVTADARELAEAFHDTCERLAPSFNYTTRTDTRKFDPDSPNGKLMQAVVAAVLAPVVARAEAAERQRDQLRAEVERLGASVTAQKLDIAIERIVDLRAQLRSAEDAIDEAKKTVVDARQAVAAAQADNHRLNAEVAVLEGQLAAAQEDKERMADLLAASLRYIPAGAFYGDFATMTKEEGSLVRQVGFAIATARGTNLDAARREGGAK